MSKLPTVTKAEKTNDWFPLDNIRYSMMRLFATNPVMFRILYLNRHRLDTPRSAATMLGSAFHEAMARYYGGNLWEINGVMETPPKDQSEAFQRAMETGMEFISAFPESAVAWTSTIPDRETAREKLAFMLNSWVSERGWDLAGVLGIETTITEWVDVEWRGLRLKPPVALSGTPDKVTKAPDGRVTITDYKSCTSYSNPDKIDGSKLIQAVQYYFLVYAWLGVAPHSCVFEEVKHSKNKDGGPQVRQYELVYDDHLIAFDLWIRLFTDMIRAINGESVWVPNFDAIYENDVALIAYIQRLDVPDDLAKMQQKHGVQTITEILRGEIAGASNMRKLLQGIERSLMPAKPIDYEHMETHEQIAAKLMEFGKHLKYESTVEGASVDMHRYHVSVGTRMAELRKFEDDLSIATGCAKVRILAPIPGTKLVGVEVPRGTRRFPGMPEPDADRYMLAIGERMDGSVLRYDLRKAPHTLVAGTTGSGKTVFMHSIISQLIAAGADMRLCDPKQVEFKRYGGSFAGTDEEINNLLAIVEAEMEGRYARMVKEDVTDAARTDMRPIFVVIDEYAELCDRAEIADRVHNIARKGRAAAIHLIVAAQRVSTKIMTGDFRAQFSAKAVFRMNRETDSRVMLDEAGAEKLLGMGDCLFATPDGIERIQAFNI